MANKKLSQEEVVARNKKAKGFRSPADIKRIKELAAENSELRMSILNMRQMYEGAIQEKMQFQGQANNLQQMLTAAVIGTRGKTLKISKKAIDSVGDYGGLDSMVVDDNLHLTALTYEQIEEMQADLEEAADEGKPI